MRALFFSMICVLIVMQAYALKNDSAYRDARKNGAITKMLLQIVQDDGIPVHNADVDVFMGMNFRPKGYYIRGQTDTNGIFIVEGKTTGDEINVNVVKTGFYRTVKVIRFAEMGHEHRVKDGRWLPYGKTEPIALRDIRNPIEMPHHFFWKFKYTKVINAWIGYDIKENDFVAPIGKGKVADFEVYIDWNGGLHIQVWRLKYDLQIRILVIMYFLLMLIASLRALIRLCQIQSFKLTRNFMNAFLIMANSANRSILIPTNVG